MSISYGFYNSLNNDRLYDAEDFSRIFDGIISDGIYESIGSKMVVRLPEGESASMTVVVGTGRAWFDHTWTYISTAERIRIPGADTAPRIDAVVLETSSLSSVSSLRANRLRVISGIPRQNPDPPELTANQHILALIDIPANVTQLSDAYIRGYQSLDPATYPNAAQFVTTVLEHESMAELWVAWEREFHTWMESLRTFAPVIFPDNMHPYDTWADLPVLNVWPYVDPYTGNTLHVGDFAKVLADETHDDDPAYYKCVYDELTMTYSWVYAGSNLDMSTFIARLLSIESRLDNLIDVKLANLIDGLPMTVVSTWDN